MGWIFVHPICHHSIYIYNKHITFYSMQQKVFNYSDSSLVKELWWWWFEIKVSALLHFLKFESVFSTVQGINSLDLNRDNVEVLGNMACTLDSSYIQKADPLILEKLKACKDFSDSQVDAMEQLLLSGNTPYGYRNSNQLTAIQTVFKGEGWQRLIHLSTRTWYTLFLRYCVIERHCLLEIH